MDTLLNYRAIIQSVLQEHADYRNSANSPYRSRILVDETRDSYALIDSGWEGDRYFHSNPIHVEIIDGLIWIQNDETESGVARDLLDRGIAQQAIVLGFRHPKVRPHTGFAIAS
jgi:hypothetical protein